MHPLPRSSTLPHCVCVCACVHGRVRVHGPVCVHVLSEPLRVSCREHVTSAPDTLKKQEHVPQDHSTFVLLKKYGIYLLDLIFGLYSVFLNCLNNMIYRHPIPALDRMKK